MGLCSRPRRCSTPARMELKSPCSSYTGRYWMPVHRENTWKRACFCAYMLEIYIKAQKHACFHVYFPFSAHLYPPCIVMVKGLLYCHKCARIQRDANRCLTSYVPLPPSIRRVSNGMVAIRPFCTAMVVSTSQSLPPSA